MLCIPVSGKNPNQRQRDILQLLAEGNSRKEIAARLQVKNAHTIRRTLENLRNRYAETTEALIAIAVTLHWFPLHVELLPIHTAADIRAIRHTVSSGSRRGRAPAARRPNGNQTKPRAQSQTPPPNGEISHPANPEHPEKGRAPAHPHRRRDPRDPRKPRAQCQTPPEKLGRNRKKHHPLPHPTRTNKSNSQGPANRTAA